MISISPGKFDRRMTSSDCQRRDRSGNYAASLYNRPLTDRNSPEDHYILAHPHVPPDRHILNDGGIVVWKRYAMVVMDFCHDLKTSRRVKVIANLHSPSAEYARSVEVTIVANKEVRRPHQTMRAAAGACRACSP